MEKKGLMGEFKEFISKGSVMDLAVGVIIGGAFMAIVNSLVNDIIMPIVGLAMGGVNFAELSINVGDAVVKYGAFIQATITFLIVAFVVFLMVKGVNASRKKKEEATEEPAPTPEDILLLQEIRDLLKK